MESEKIENIWIEVLIPKSKGFLLGIFYRPPETSKYLSADFNSVFKDMLQKCSNENKETNMLGDFNVNFMNNDHDKDIKSVFRLYGYKQIVRKATRITNNSATLIDLIATNYPTFFVFT